MCGIGGILHPRPEHTVNPDALVWISRILKHRGPDDCGVMIEGPCGLCHTRLSIIDLSPRGHQPMASASGRYWLTYNGEIYNYRELRSELRAAGCHFDSDSDTEVILHLIEGEGPAALERLEGMFAFAVYDRVRRELLLMRDRVGIKPLFWTTGDDGFAFASEPKALPRLSDRGAPTAERLAEYIAFRHWAGVESPLPGVQTLLPGHRLITNGRDISIERWWTPKSNGRADPEATGAIVSEAVGRQLVSDVPIGVFLSGGVDSALVTAAARKRLPALDSFTVGFHERRWDETARAHVVSDLLGTTAHEFRIEADEYVRDLASAVWHLDAPLNHAHSVHLLALSRFARERITVALTGEGSDELFAGYPRYRLLLMSHWLRRLPLTAVRQTVHRLSNRRHRLARLLEAAALDSTTAAITNAAFVPIEEASLLVGLQESERALEPRRALFEQSRRRGLNEIQSLLELERQTYLVSLLQRMDRMSMAVGLECRVPFLDERVIDHALSLRIDERLSLFDSKKPIRYAAAKIFGRNYCNAPKSGFGVPLNKWFRSGNSLAKLLSLLLEDRLTRCRGWFDIELAKRLLMAHRSGYRNYTEVLWGLLNLELWARVCLDSDGPKCMYSPW